MRFNLHIPNLTLSGFAGASDHGALGGLSDDDHTQYYNQARGDVRYALSGSDVSVVGSGLYLVGPIIGFDIAGFGDLRYQLSGSAAGPHLFSSSSHTDVAGTWTSGRLTIFDGTNHVPLASGFFVGRDELLQQYNLELDEAAGSITYIGEALPGSATSSPLWRIKRLDESDGTVELIIKWADGNDDFDNVWDDRASLSYS